MSIGKQLGLTTDEIKRGRRLMLAAVAAFPLHYSFAQEMCSVSGMTLQEALAAWQDSQKKAQLDRDSYKVVLQRRERALFRGKKDGVDAEEMGVISTLSVNGTVLGTVVENDALRIKAGEYRGVVRYVSSKGFVQGPLGKMGNSGDLLLEVAGVPSLDPKKNRSDLLFHQGTQPWHSQGCILAGAASKKVVGGREVVTIADDSTLRKMRHAFYGTDGTPNACPNKVVRITINDIL